MRRIFYFLSGRGEKPGKDLDDKASRGHRNGHFTICASNDCSFHTQCFAIKLLKLGPKRANALLAFRHLIGMRWKATELCS